MNYIQRLKDALKDKALFKFCQVLAKINNINLYIHDDYHDKFKNGPVRGCTLGPNKLDVSTSISPSLLLHELCHLLVVEPEYRHLMSKDTVLSYKTIAKLKGESTYRSDGATFALQHLILSNINLSSYISSEFYTGILGDDQHTLKPRWLESAHQIFDSINIPEYISPNTVYSNTYVNGSYIEAKTNLAELSDNTAVTIVRVVKEYDYDLSYDDAIFKNGNFYIGNHKLDRNDVYAWSRKNI